MTCAGLHADLVARMGGGTSNPKVVTFRGTYYQACVAPCKMKLLAFFNKTIVTFGCKSRAPEFELFPFFESMLRMAPVYAKFFEEIILTARV